MHIEEMRECLEALWTREISKDKSELKGNKVGNLSFHTFMSGWYSGFSLPFFITLVCLFLEVSSQDVSAFPHVWSSFPVYRMILTINFHAFLHTINLFIWSQVKVNYIFILSLKSPLAPVELARFCGSFFIFTGIPYSIYLLCYVAIVENITNPWVSQLRNFVTYPWLLVIVLVLFIVYLSCGLKKVHIDLYKLTFSSVSPCLSPTHFVTHGDAFHLATRRPGPGFLAEHTHCFCLSQMK